MTPDEVDDLRIRLAEAEDTIRAIRQGEVDALVVGDNGHTAVFEIGGDADSYRTFMEVMDVGAAALDADGRILYANATLLSAIGAELVALQGRRFADVAGPEVGAAIDRILDRQANGPLTAELQFQRGRDHAYFIATAKPIRLGTTDGFALTFTDVTERVRAENAVQSERAARAVIASANEAVLVCDRQGIITHANGAASIVYAGNVVGKKFADVVPLVFPGATGLMQAEDIISLAVDGGSIQGIEATAPQAPKVTDFLISAAPLQVGGDAISGCVITMVDLSQRKAAEKQQMLLMRELDHRVKNTLALVLSIAGRTVHNEDTLEGFHKSFTGRIQALSATHNLLAENSWSNLTLGDVVRGELAPYIGGTSGRVNFEGLDVHVQPRAAIAFGLIIHELTTNAAKYGALSVPDGIISVTMAGRTEGEDGSLIIEWQENSGPAVAQPTRKGFGQSVITRSLQYSPGGGAELHYDREGLRCVIRIPAVDVT